MNLAETIGASLKCSLCVPFIRRVDLSIGWPTLWLRNCCGTQRMCESGMVLGSIRRYASIRTYCQCIWQDVIVSGAVL